MCVTPLRAPGFIKVAPNFNSVSLASLRLQSLRSAYGRQNGCSCARSHPQESLPDVSDWEARPMRCRLKDAGRVWGGEIDGVISFRKMRHLCRPSHCGSLSTVLSIMTTNSHPPPTGAQTHTRFLNKTQRHG